MSVKRDKNAENVQKINNNVQKCHLTQSVWKNPGAFFMPKRRRKCRLSVTLLRAGRSRLRKRGALKVQKVDEDKRLVFGWANVSVDVGGNEVVDLQEDMIDPETLEAAAYKFAELYRDGGEMHERTGTAVMVESVVLTEEKQAAMGLAAGTLPVGWWIGFRVTDDDVWEKVKSGEYSMFSIGGTAIREEVEDDDGAAAE